MIFISQSFMPPILGEQFADELASISPLKIKRLTPFSFAMLSNATYGIDKCIIILDFLCMTAPHSMEGPFAIGNPIFKRNRHS